MAAMLMKSSLWAYGCDCSQCRPRRERQEARQVARRKEERAWRSDQGVSG